MTEDQIIENTEREVFGLIGHPGWAHAKAMLTDKIMDLQSIRNISDTLSPEQVVLDIKARNTAIEILTDWLRQVEGTAANFEKPQPIVNDSHILEV